MNGLELYGSTTARQQTGCAVGNVHTAPEERENSGIIQAAWGVFLYDFYATLKINMHSL
jgi:hypothetical protein